MYALPNCFGKRLNRKKLLWCWPTLKPDRQRGSFCNEQAPASQNNGSAVTKLIIGLMVLNLPSLEKYLIFLLLIVSTSLFAQVDTTFSRVTLSGDFRFRIEHDWKSRKATGDYRNNRLRLRYRLRAEFKYQHNSWASVGARIRTGNPRKQQDPQLTFGGSSNEFGTLPIGLEKVYFAAHFDDIKIWIGKNTFPFRKQNELFWSDNVYPEGLYAQKKFRWLSSWVDQLTIGSGHFILNSQGGTLDQDSYIQGIQLASQHFRNRLEVWPTLYLFRNIPNIPDGAATYQIDYTILSVGTRLELSKLPAISAEIDWYQNLKNYQSNDSIPIRFQDQRRGLVVAIRYRKPTLHGDYLLKLTYARLERYAALDFMAQNDWARWDYSSYGSPDGRLTNFEGIELTAAVKLEDNISLKMKYYLVNQLVLIEGFRENGQRIRFDIDITF